MVILALDRLDSHTLLMQSKDTYLQTVFIHMHVLNTHGFHQGKIISIIFDAN